MLDRVPGLLLPGSEDWDLDPESSGVESAVEAVTILVICVAIVMTNVLVILMVVTAPGPQEAVDLYVLSVAVADLLCGVFIVPLSIYPAIVRDWVYGDLVCRLTGFLGLTLWSVCLYTFMWISVDRYLAIRKPLRYDVIQTRTRCQCWMVFTWLTSVFLWTPPLLGFSKGRFYADGYVCMLDLGNMIPYSITLAVLVLVPTLLTIGYTYFYILSTMYKLRRCLTKEEREYATAVSENLSNPDHLMSFVLILIFWITWMPWFCFRIYEQVIQYLARSKDGGMLQDPHLRGDYHALHFWLFWLGVSDCAWKFFVYVSMSPKYRLSLKRLCLTMCCRPPPRQPLIV